MTDTGKSFFGFLNINKPVGITSHDVISKLRRITKIKQIGHTGTLDPAASGVLPVAIGKAAKLIEYLKDDKEYSAIVQFGKTTSTYDREGEIVQTYDKRITKQEVITALKNFEGEIEQLPPIYSAVKVNGKKLYDYARKGLDVDIKPRKVFISKIELKEFEPEKQSAKILIACSKGTYIRSVAHDLGKILDCGAYLSSLERTKAGLFSIENSINLDDIKQISDIEKNLINPVNILDLPVYELNEEEMKRVNHGMYIANSEFQNLDIVILTYGGKIFAVGRTEQNKILVKKVLEVI